MAGAVADPAPSERAAAKDDARAWSMLTVGLSEVLLVEPDPDEADRLRAALEKRSIPVGIFSSPWHALAHLARNEAAVLVASARLGSSALRDLVEAVRAETEIPVLIAFGPEDVQTIGAAVIAGGRPLVTLPYNAQQLVRAVADIVPTAPAPLVFEVGRLSIVPQWQDAHLDDRGLDLSPIEFRILTELARRGGRAVSRTALIHACWPNPPANPKSILNAAIKRIRHKLESLGVADSIETVRGVGYRLNVSALAHPQGESGVGPKPISERSTSTRREISATMRRTSAAERPIGSATGQST